MILLPLLPAPKAAYVVHLRVLVELDPLTYLTRKELWYSSASKPAAAQGARTQVAVQAVWDAHPALGVDPRQYGYLRETLSKGPYTILEDDYQTPSKADADEFVAALYSVGRPLGSLEWYALTGQVLTEGASPDVGGIKPVPARWEALELCWLGTTTRTVRTAPTVKIPYDGAIAP